MHYSRSFGGHLHGFRLRNQRRRRLSNTDSCTESPGDSGYDSPEEPHWGSAKGGREKSLLCLDGTGSLDSDVDESISSENSGRDGYSPPLRLRRIRSASSPSLRSCPSHESDSFQTTPTPVEKSSRRWRSKPTFPRSYAVDRFIPLRDNTVSPSERYRTTRQVNMLTISERLLRLDIASTDPFATPGRYDNDISTTAAMEEDRLDEQPQSQGR